MLLKRSKKQPDNSYKNFMEAHGFIPITQTEEQDIHIIGYPKSGNTWMQYLITCLAYGVDPRFVNDTLAQTFVPDVHYMQYYKRFSKVCFFKSHALPGPVFKRVIYLVRDGRDAILSYYHMNKALDPSLTIQQMVYDRKMIISHWDEHITEWKKNSYGANILFVKYEDLLNNGVETLEKICAFAGLKHERSFIETVNEGCRFEKLQNKEKHVGMDMGRSLDPTKVKLFFRKGLIGGYKEELDAETINYLNKRYMDTLTSLGYQI